MAITRTQQAKQMLKEGGRTGFFSAGLALGDEISPGTASKQPTSGGPARRDDAPDLSFMKDDIKKFQEKEKLKDKPPPKKPEETEFQKFKRKFNPFPLATSILNRIGASKFARINNAKQRQNYIDSLDLTNPKEKEEYDRIMNQLGGLGMDIIAGPKKIGVGPPSTGFTDQFEMPQAPPGMLKTQFKTVDGVSALGNPGVDDILGTGYDEYLNRFNTEDTGGRDDRPMELDPCKGPNPPAYCFIGEKADETQEDVITRNLAGLTPRIGGSIFDFTGMADGGIASIDREAFLLGGIAKGLKKAVRGVKKIAKSPIGKAALIASGGYLLGGGIIPGVSGKLIPFAKYGSSAGSGFGFGNILPNILNIAKMPGLAEKAFSMGTTGKALTGILGASLLSGLMTPKEDEDEFDVAKYYAQNQLTPSQSVRGMGSEFDFYGNQFVANGGRIGYEEAGAVMSKEDMEKMAKSPLYKGFKTMYSVDPSMAKENEAYKDKFKQFEQLFKKGYQEGGDVEPVAKKTMPLIDMGGKEKDYRETGGFVDMGRMERADDVPARLSKNEFVFTADAVRNAGEGDIDKGAEVMYNMMKNLEAGGEVSEESQGLEGAREMFKTSQRLGEVL